MGTKIYNNIFVGCGPATVFSLLAFPQRNCLVLEKGKSLKERDPKEVLFGFGGAGAFSDAKLVVNPLVGGDIRNLVNIKDDLFYSLADDILFFCNNFNRQYSFYPKIPSWLHQRKKLEWLLKENYNIKSNKLKLLESKVCHIGSNRGREIFESIENCLRKENEIHFEEEVISIHREFMGCKPTGVFLVKTNKKEYFTTKVVIAVGKRSNLVEKIQKDFNLGSKLNKIQIGVRVETPMTDKLQELVDKFYDFKLVMESKLGRWRTFCCCAKEAYVAVERNEDFISVNGAANEGSNGLVNFGVMGELDLGWDRKKQIEMMQKINNGTNKLLAQNIRDFKSGAISTELDYRTTVKEEDYRFDNLGKYLPLEVFWEMRDFIEELEKELDIQGHLFAPEIKLTNNLLQLDSNFQTEIKGLYLIGDCSGYTRSIVQSAITGMLVGNHLIGGGNG